MLKMSFRVVHPHTIRLANFVLTRELHVTESCRDYQKFESHKIMVPIFDPNMKKPPVDLNKHDPKGIFTPAVHEFIQARDYENSGGRKINVVTFDWKDYCGTVEVNDFVFATNPRIDILHQNMRWYRDCIRAGTASVKTRGDVRGGAKKPWRQKGTGRARHGSKVDTTQRGGGRVKGPKPKDFSWELPFRMRRMGLRVALTCKLAQGDLEVVENFDSELLSKNSKDFNELLRQNRWDNALLVDAYEHEEMYALTRELNQQEINEKIHTTHVSFLHVYGILARQKLVLSLNALRVLDEKLSDDGRVIVDQRYRLLRQDTFDEELLIGEYCPKRNMVVTPDMNFPKYRSKYIAERKKMMKPKPKNWAKQIPRLEPFVDGKPPPLPSTSIRGNNMKDVMRVRLRSGGLIDSTFETD